MDLALHSPNWTAINSELLAVADALQWMLVQYRITNLLHYLDDLICFQITGLSQIKDGNYGLHAPLLVWGFH